MIQAMEEGFSVADRVQIEELYARHAWALDTADVDGLVELYTEDAVIDDVGTGRFEGAGAARRFAEAARDDPDFRGRQHWSGHDRVVRDGARCRVTAVRSGGPAALVRRDVPAVAGVHGGRSRRPGRVWLFAERRFRRWEGSVLSGFRGR